MLRCSSRPATLGRECHAISHSAKIGWGVKRTAALRPRWHGRTWPSRTGAGWRVSRFLAATQKPGDQLNRRGGARGRTNQLDFVPELCRRHGGRRLREPGGNAKREPTSHQLEQGPTATLRRAGRASVRVVPAGRICRARRAASTTTGVTRGRHAPDDKGRRRLDRDPLHVWAISLLGKVTHIIIREFERSAMLRSAISARSSTGFCVLKVKRAGQRRECPPRSGSGVRRK